MPTDRDNLSAAKAWLERETAADPALGKLLAGVPEGLFGPEPKRVSLEHWKLIEEKAKRDTNADPSKC
ncbi:hypothetical protein [Labrys neptuniae]